MKRHKISLLFIICLFVLAGCNKSYNKDSELQILGLSTKNIEKMEIIHGNKILYPDLQKNDNLTLIEDLNTAFENTADRIASLDEDLDITLADAEGYAQNDAENYYVFITFSSQQTISFENNSNEERQNCDGVLFDINNMRLYWSKEGDFAGTMGYADNSASVEKEFSTFKKELEKIFDDL